MFGNSADRRGKLQELVEPLPNVRNQGARGGFFPRRGAAGDPGVAGSPAWMVTRPSCTLYGYSNRPRSGGPEAREPSWEYAPPQHGHMNKLDCGNQRTGQPRCAHLMANISNCSPASRLTNHAVSPTSH